ncbi:MAG: hypothetical protein AAFP20_15245 [Cyanobacteria bacterium J06614_10]
MARLPYRPKSWRPLRKFIVELRRAARRSRFQPEKVRRNTWLQHRLREAAQRKVQPSRLMARLAQKQARRRLLRRVALACTLTIAIAGGTWSHLFFQEKVTLGGVPYGIIDKFWNDRIARNAYFAGDRQGLHDRLQVLGVEEDIKDFYRDRFTNEHELDRYIHQIMFDRTGYVGEAYEVNNYGRLISVKYKR